MNLQDSPANFQFNLKPYNIQPRSDGRYSIKNVTIPFSWYVTVYQPIPGSIYGSFVINDPVGGLSNIVIPPGNYSATTLSAIIISTLNAAGHTGYTIIYNQNTNKFTISAAFTFDIYSNSTNNYYSYQQLFNVMGFGENYLSGSTTTITSTYPVNLSGDPNVYIRSSALSYLTNSYFNNLQDNIICSVPVNAPPFGTIIYQDPQVIKQPFYTKQTNIIDIQLVDEHGHIINTNQDWSFSITIYNELI